MTQPTPVPKYPEGEPLPSIDTPVSPEYSHSEDGYEWSAYVPPIVPMPLYQLQDEVTGVVVSTSTAIEGQRTASIHAWSAGRHSREPGNMLRIKREIQLNQVSSADKLGTFVSAYGHNSLADLAEIYVDFEDISMLQAFRLFHMTQVHGGQEKSTRYQRKFQEKALIPLENILTKEQAGDAWEGIRAQYERLGGLAMQLFDQNLERTAFALTQHYEPQTKKEEKAVELRAMDCARFFFLLGQRTGMTKKATARTWSGIIAELKASEIDSDVRLAQQIQRLLAPDAVVEEALHYTAEAPTLVRHTEADTQFHENLTILGTYLREKTDFLSVIVPVGKFQGERQLNATLITGEYTVGEKMAAQYILTLYPGASLQQVLSWVETLPDNTKRELSVIMFNGHSDHEQLPQQAVTSELTYVYNAPIGISRDLNRHRSEGRFTPFPFLYGKSMNYDQMQQVLSHGYVLPYHVTHIPELKAVYEAFSHDMEYYYEQLREFVASVHAQCGDSIDYSFVVNLLPLGHMVPFIMHADPKKTHYLTRTRAKAGGQADYQYLAMESAKLTAEADPLLSGIQIPKQDILEREFFFGRK
jgi:thymidylate synthase ThyX